MRARRFHAFQARLPFFLRPLAGALGLRLGRMLARLARPRRPRHPLTKLGLGLIGLAVLAVLLVVGVVLGSAMLAAGLVARTLRRGPRRPVEPQAVVAEYRVLRKPQLSAPARWAAHAGRVWRGRHARARGAHSIFAGVSAENPEGRRFHIAMGYTEIATLPAVGHKFGRWMDLHLLQKILT